MCKKLNLVFFPKHYSNVTWQFETLQTFQICQIWYLCKWMKIVWGERNLGTVVFLKSCSWCCKRFLSVSAFTRSKTRSSLCNTFFVWSLWLHIICTSSLQESLPPGTDKWYTRRRHEWTRSKLNHWRNTFRYRWIQSRNCGCCFHFSGYTGLRTYCCCGMQVRIHLIPKNRLEQTWEKKKWT